MQREQGFRERGRIVKFIPERGWGFLERDGCPDIFTHISEFEPGAAELIRVGMGVEFTVTQDERGRLQAVGVELL